jgi:hypothetical protein
MTMSVTTRKFMLTTHVLSSIGWFGALLVFFAHSVASLASGDPILVRSVCVAMALIAWFVILPLSLASFATGVIQALGTAWRLIRHYWVVAKLLLTAFATAILLLKLAPISDLAAAAQQASFASSSLVDLKQSLLVHSVGGLVVLILITVLAIYKPAGVTPFASAGERRTVPRWVRLSVIVVAALALVLGLLVMHGGHGPAMHSLHTS